MVWHPIDQRFEETTNKNREIHSFKSVIISRETLAERISATKGKCKVQKLSLIIQGELFILGDLIDLTFAADKNLAFRAAGILEKLVFEGS